MRRNWLKTRIRSRVVVYTIDDQVVEGLMTALAGDGVVLASTVLRSDSDVPLQGDLFIPTAKVRFIQVVSTS